MKISNCIKQFENEKKEKITELVIEIFVESILNRCHEEKRPVYRL